MPAAAATWREVLNRGHRRLTIALVGLEFMVGIQYLVVTAVMPRVQKEIGGIAFSDRSGIEKRRPPSRT